MPGKLVWKPARRLAGEWLRTGKALLDEGGREDQDVDVELPVVFHLCRRRRRHALPVDLETHVREDFTDPRLVIQVAAVRQDPLVLSLRLGLPELGAQFGGCLGEDGGAAGEQDDGAGGGAQEGAGDGEAYPRCVACYLDQAGGAMAGLRVDLAFKETNEAASSQVGSSCDNS